MRKLRLFTLILLFVYIFPLFSNAQQNPRNETITSRADLAVKMQEAQNQLDINDDACLDQKNLDECLRNNKVTYERRVQELKKMAVEAGVISASEAGGKKGFWSSVWDGVLKISDYGTGVLRNSVYLILYGILFIIMAAMSSVVYLSAALFDMSMFLSISNFKQVVESSGLISTWEIIRNLINTSFIFILLYISFSIILGNFGPKKKSTVASVIISAVLINFSFFFTEVAIDLGNWIAVSLWSSIESGGGILNQISGMFMQSIGGASIMDVDKLSASGQAAVITLLVLQIIFLGTLIWGFCSAAVLIIGRTVGLIILLAISPIGFVGESIPWLKEKSDEWRTSLVNQISVAPIFVFFLILTFKMTQAQDDIRNIMANMLSGNAWGKNVDLGNLLNYVLAISLLITGIKVTKKLSGKVGEWAGKIGKAILAAIAIAVTGGIAIAGASTATISAAAEAGRLTTGMRATRAARGIFTGDITNETGVAGMIGRPTRSGIISTVKDLTSKKVDLDKLQEDYKEMVEDEQKRILKQVNDIGPAKAEEKKRQITSTLENIDSQARARLDEDVNGKKLKEEKEQADKDIAASTASITALGKDIEALDARLKSNPNDMTAITELADKHQQLQRQNGLHAGLEQVQKQKEGPLNDFLNKAREEVAKDMGIVADATGSYVGTLAAAAKAAEADIIKGRDAQNKFAAQIEGGTWMGTGLTASDRTKVANMVRAQKGKVRDDSDILKIIKKHFKDTGEKIDEEDDDD